MCTFGSGLECAGGERRPRQQGERESELRNTKYNIKREKQVIALPEAREMIDER